MSAERKNSASRYFTDLRIISCLIAASWPAARDLVEPGAQAGLVEEHVQTIRSQIGAARTTGRSREIIFYDRLPADAAVTASLLATADRLVCCGDPEILTQALRPMVGATPFVRSWLKQYTAGQGYCSQALRTAIKLEQRHHLRIQDVRDAASDHQSRPVSFDTRHIPQFLLDEWHERFLAHISGAPPRHLRRAAAALLATSCLGGTLREASASLDMPPSAGTYALNSVRHHLDHDTYNRFTAAVKDLEVLLNTTTPLTDFGHRREALIDWSIPPADWAELIDGLAGKTHSQREIDTWTHWGEGKRALSSVWIWTAVTGGDHVYAPLLEPEPGAPRWTGGPTHYIHTRWRFISDSPRGHYGPLRERLDRYASQLATAIDEGTFTIPEPHTDHGRTR